MIAQARNARKREQRESERSELIPSQESEERAGYAPGRAWGFRLTVGAPRVVCVPLEKPVPYQVANRQPRFHALASDELLVTEIHQSSKNQSESFIH